MNPSEELFAKFLNRNKYPFLFIDQAPSTFSSHLKFTKSKRPDFLVFLPHGRVIAFDVKCRRKTKQGSYIIDEGKDISPHMQFQKLFNIPVWYAIDPTTDDTNWYFGALDFVVDKCTVLTSKDGDFRAIDIKACLTSDHNEGSLGHNTFKK